MGKTDEVYQDFINNKAQDSTEFGFTPLWVPDFLFDFQKALLVWALKKGRAAIFADCGLGKTIIQLVWAENICRKYNKPVLILTPLAVSGQTIREGKKFGIQCYESREGKVFPGITVTNYERLHYFNPNDFIGVVCDESSILKHFSGGTQKAVTEFLRKMSYSLLCTATAAPNDYFELGTSSEALGHLGYMDMLSRFFKNQQNLSPIKRWNIYDKWRFKTHAEGPFWQWVCSWARAIRKPSDLGFGDAEFILPPLKEQIHNVGESEPKPGNFFSSRAVSLENQRTERRQMKQKRCEKVASLIVQTEKSALVWCHFNYEGDLLTKLIPSAVQMSGLDSIEEKEEKILAFTDQKIRVLVTKPVIGAWGMNWQHCSHITTFLSHSYEQYYQGIRRCWRFGQKNPVTVDIIMSEGEQPVLANLHRKSHAADKMFSELTHHMNDPRYLQVSNPFTQTMEVPKWL